MRRTSQFERSLRWAAATLLLAGGLGGCAQPSRTVQRQPVPVARPTAPPAAPLVAPIAAPPDAAPVPWAAASSAEAPAYTSPIRTSPPAGDEPGALTPPPDATPAWVESAGVSARFPEPAVAYRTPAFDPGRTGYTSDAELRAVLQGLVSASATDPNASTPSVRWVQAGSSQAGVPLAAVHIGRSPPSLSSPVSPGRPQKPTVLLIGQQHGDEPAGAEALIVVANELARGSLAPLLDRIDVVILPRANPDGALAEKRLTASGIDVNRDHLLLRTPEAQAQAQLVRDFAPVVVVDSHEYSVAGRYLEKFGALQRFDALIQYATVANLPEFVTRASEEWFRKPMLQALQAQGLSSEWYYTTSLDLADKKVSMGGVQPDTGRNVNGLRNAVSFLIETRGIGLGREHLARRVHTHVTAIASVLKSAAGRADDLLKLRRFVDADVASKLCQGEVVVEAAATPSEYTLLMLDPQTGADKPVAVAWDSALQLAVSKRRARPCGYWLGADQTDAALRLRGLGVLVQRLDETGTVQGESYTEVSSEAAQRSDVRGALAEAGGMLRIKVDLVPALVDVRAGSYYIGLDQPLANLVVAAMEPDTQNSYAANRVVTGVSAQARVLRRPTLKMTSMP